MNTSISDSPQDTSNSGGQVLILSDVPVYPKTSFYVADYDPTKDYYKDCPMCWQEVEKADARECIFCEADLTPPKKTNETEWE